jgi:GDP-4-dehydro-6-deoxy-D-mannose reductase
VSGFIGNRLAAFLAASGHTVTGTCLGSPRPIEGVEILPADLLDRGALAEVVTRGSPHAVVHLGGLSHVGNSWGAIGEYFRVNVLGTERLLDAAGKVPFVLASSGEVYGEVPEWEQPLGEDRLPLPSSPYALTKAAAERLVLATGGTVARLFNVIGAGQSPRFALPSFAAQLNELRAQKGRGVLKVGNLEPRRDFLHLEDAVEGLRTLIESGEGGEIYNLGSGEAHSIGEVLAWLIEVSGVDAEVVEDPARVRPVDLPLLCADNRRIREIGWTPRRNLVEALEDIWREAIA